MAEAVVWPVFAYVPGKTQRHPEGAFDEIRATAKPDLSAAELADCQAFRTGLLYLDAGFHWEAHEVLEPVWMVLPDDSEDRRFVQALIQLANGLLKLKMDRPKAALRLAGIARDLVPDRRTGVLMTVEIEETHQMIDSLEALANDAL